MPHDWHGEFDEKHGPALWGCAGWAATVQAANERSAAYPKQIRFGLAGSRFEGRIRRAFPIFAQHAQHLRLLHSHQIDQRPNTPDWLHEIKYDGYRLRLGDRVRLITKGGYNWTNRYPWIIEAALKNRFKRFVIDGEAGVLGVDGVAYFNVHCTRAGVTTKCNSMPSTF
jgi:ATP-dependent DNA ligase